MENRTLDQTDREILAALTNNARLSNKELAAMVGLAPSSCHERVRRLIDSRAIVGFHAEVDPAVLGYGIEAMIAVRLPQHSRRTFEAFREYVTTIPEVLDVYHVSGEIDFLIHVVARDPQHLRDLALDRFLSRPEVGHIETELIFDHLRPAVHA